MGGVVGGDRGGSYRPGDDRGGGDWGGIDPAERDAPELRGTTRCALEALQALATILCFVGFTLAWAALEGRLGGVAAERAYPSAAVTASDPPLSRASLGLDGGGSGAPPRVWLVDGFNVLHAGVLVGRDRSGWWSEAGRGRLLARAARFDDPEAEIWVVFDGRVPVRPDAPLPSGRTGLQVVFAPSADDWLLARVRSAEEPARLAVVTADRRLAARAAHRGARVISPRAFLARCGAEPAGA
jgi:predicted RNA-binding protein with PIN domain